MPNLSQSDLDHLSALAEKATPGPWKIVITDGRIYVHGPQNKEWICDVGPIDFYISPENDADFIAAVREAVPALISDRRELSSQLAQAQAERDAAQFLAEQNYAAMQFEEKRVAERQEQVNELQARIGAFIDDHSALTAERHELAAKVAELSVALGKERSQSDAAQAELEKARAALRKAGGLAANVTTLKHAPAWLMEQAQTMNDLCENLLGPKED